MHKLEFALESKKHKIIWDFRIQTDHQISICRSSHWPDESGIRVFWWVQAQGHRQGTPGGFKNALGFVGIPLKSGASGASNKSSPYEEG